MILAIGMATRLFSDGFDFLYPLRFGGALCALWIYRTSYRKLDWRFQLAGRGDGHADIRGLGFGRPCRHDPAAAAFRARWSQRCRPHCLDRDASSGGAIVTVPIAEELAYRGYPHASAHPSELRGGFLSGGALAGAPLRSARWPSAQFMECFGGRRCWRASVTVGWPSGRAGSAWQLRPTL